MSDEFEKKSGRKGGIIALVVILIIAAIAGAIYYFVSNKKNPDKLFEKAIEDAFEMTEGENVNSAKVELELSAQVEGKYAEVKMINSILSDIKLKVSTEMDRKQKIANTNLTALYGNDEVINTTAFIQDDSIYLYLKDIFSKFIEIDTEELEDEGIALAQIFGEASDVEAVTKLVKNVKQILLDAVKDKEVTQEKEELNDKSVTKSTIKFSTTEIVDVLEKVLKEVNKISPSEEIEDMLDDIKYEKKYIDDDVVEIEVSIYSKGIKNDIVKTEIIITDNDSEQVMVIEINKDSDNITTINVLFNNYSTKANKAEKIAEITLEKTDKNSGIATLKFEVEGVTLKLNVKYKVDYNVKVEKADVSKSVLIEDITEKDQQEMMQNIEKNEMLKSLIENYNFELPIPEVDYVY